MNTATFEGMYAAFTRLELQRTWDGMLMAPLTLDDIILGEIVWCATRSVVSCAAIFIVAGFLVDEVRWLSFVVVMGVVFLTGLCFGAMALVVTAFARSYDFFLYYFTLVVTPLMLFSGVFFPIEAMPGWLQAAAHAFPLAHAVEIVRPVMLGEVPHGWVGHLAMIGGVTLVAAYAATVFLRRRLQV
jgi:lipooligosaccharide transport system permease protein